MKTVYLFRHGDSEESGFERDYCRTLTGEGELRSEAMSEYLKKSGYRPDLIMTSGAVRAKATAYIAAKAFGYPESEIVIEDIIYESKKVEEILPLIMNSSTKISGIMIVGHNPLLSEFIKYITGFSADVSMKKSSVIRIDFKNKEWKTITPGSGKIRFYKIFVNGGIVDAADEHP